MFRRRWFPKSHCRRKCGGNIVIKMKWTTSVLTKPSLFIVFNDDFAPKLSLSIHILVAFYQEWYLFFIFFRLSHSAYEKDVLSLSLSAGKTSSIWRSSNDTTSKGSTRRECCGSHHLRRRTRRRYPPPPSNPLSWGSMTTTRSPSIEIACSRRCCRQRWWGLWHVRVAATNDGAVLGGSRICEFWREGSDPWHGSWGFMLFWTG